MTMNQFKNMLSRVALQKPEGFTFNPLMNCFPTKGYVVAASETQDCVGVAGLIKVIKFYLKHIDYCIGGWRNEEGIMQYDASKVYMNIDDAISAAVENGQRAIYNLFTGSVIMASDYHSYSSCSIAA